MKTNISKAIEQKLVRFIEKHWELGWVTPTGIAVLRMGVLAERDLKLENFMNINCGKLPEIGDTKFRDLQIKEIASHWGNFKIVVDSAVDDYYCEFELISRQSVEYKLYEPERVVNHENTLENFKGYKSGRCCGNTTRLADHAIQIIMSGKICHILDHHNMGKAPHANNMLAHKVMLRLYNEFGHLQFKYDPFKNTISFKNIIDV